MSHEILLIDAGTGNLRSVQKALVKLGIGVTLTNDPRTIRNGGRIVLPGVGAFGDFMLGLRLRDLVEPINQAVKRGDPLLGICVGMQALFDMGEERGEHRGIGLLPGKVGHFPLAPGLKIPHTGWNLLKFPRFSPLFSGIGKSEYVYFNHSYICTPEQPTDICACTTHGIEFASAVQKENLFGVQFHPEKSQRVGLQILENFIKLHL